MYKYKRLLLVDDDEDDRELFEAAVNELNNNIVCVLAPNGVEGLVKLKLPPPPEIIFVDINMPLMNGFEYLQALKLEPMHIHIPAVIFTTSDNYDDRYKAKQLGAAGYIVKPPNFQQLKNALMKILTSDLS